MPRQVKRHGFATEARPLVSVARLDVKIVFNTTQSRIQHEPIEHVLTVVGALLGPSRHAQSNNPPKEYNFPHYPDVK